MGVLLHPLIVCAAGSVDPASPSFPSPTIRPAPTTAEAHLNAVQRAVTQAVESLRITTTYDRGGFVEKAQADIIQASAEVKACIAYTKAQSEIGSLPVTAVPALVALRVRLDDFSERNSKRLNGAVNPRNTVGFLQTAISELQQLPNGDDGGARYRLIADLGQTISDLIAAIEFTPDLPDPRLPPIPVVVRGPDGQTLTVLSAFFGADTRTRDVTARVAELIQPQAEPVLVSNNTLKADPAPYVTKTVLITYQYQGETKSIRIQEGDILSYQTLAKAPSKPAPPPPDANPPSPPKFERLD